MFPLIVESLRVIDDSESTSKLDPKVIPLRSTEPRLLIFKISIGIFESKDELKSKPLSILTDSELNSINENLLISVCPEICKSFLDVIFKADGFPNALLSTIVFSIRT